MSDSSPGGTTLRAGAIRSPPLIVGEVHHQQHRRYSTSVLEEVQEAEPEADTTRRGVEGGIDNLAEKDSEKQKEREEEEEDQVSQTQSQKESQKESQEQNPVEKKNISEPGPAGNENSVRAGASLPSLEDCNAWAQAHKSRHGLFDEEEEEEKKGGELEGVKAKSDHREEEASVEELSDKVMATVASLKGCKEALGQAWHATLSQGQEAAKANQAYADELRDMGSMLKWASSTISKLQTWVSERLPEYRQEQSEKMQDVQRQYDMAKGTETGLDPSASNEAALKDLAKVAIDIDANADSTPQTSAGRHQEEYDQGEEQKKEYETEKERGVASNKALEEDAQSNDVVPAQETNTAKDGSDDIKELQTSGSNNDLHGHIRSRGHSHRTTRDPEEKTVSGEKVRGQSQEGKREGEGEKEENEPPRPLHDKDVSSIKEANARQRGGDSPSRDVGNKGISGNVAEFGDSDKWPSDKETDGNKAAAAGEGPEGGDSINSLEKQFAVDAAVENNNGIVGGGGEIGTGGGNALFEGQVVRIPADPRL